MALKVVLIILGVIIFYLILVRIETAEKVPHVR